MLIVSFLLILSNMTGHSWISIEELLTSNKSNLVLFFSVMTIEFFFTEIVNVNFSLDKTFIESFDPEEVARESSLMEEDDKVKIEDRMSKAHNPQQAVGADVVQKTIQTLQNTFNSTFNKTENATLGLDKTFNNTSAQLIKKARNPSLDFIHFSEVKVADIELNKEQVFERSDGLGVAFIGTYKSIQIKVR